MTEEILANENNMEVCREMLLNNIQVLIDSYITSPHTDTSMGNRNLIFNILFSKNIINSLEDKDLLHLIKKTNIETYNILDLKSLYDIPENSIQN